MKRQVLVIHGGDSFATYGEYLDALRSSAVELEGSRGWKSGLGEALGEEYQVILPRMPNTSDAKFEEWKIWLDKYLALVDDGLILAGHSLGGSFLAKYLATNQVPKVIAATFLVAAPFDSDGGRALVEFDSPDSLQLLEQQGGKVFLYHSEDDPIVDFVELRKFTDRLPRAKIQTFTDRGHFIGETFPEIVHDIKSLT